MMQLNSPSLHGWIANGEPEWPDQYFPDVRDLLLLPHLDDEVDFDEDSEEDISDDDNDNGEEEELWWRVEIGRFICWIMVLFVNYSITRMWKQLFFTYIH